MITYEAKEVVARTVAQQEARPLRLQVHEDGAFELHTDSPRPDDLTFTHEGELLLIVDCGLAIELDGKQLDVEPSDEGPRLSLRDR